MQEDHETEQPSSPEHRPEPGYEAASDAGEEPSPPGHDGESEPEEADSEQQGPKEQGQITGKHKPTQEGGQRRRKPDGEGSQSTRRAAVSFPRDIEREITAFLKEKPALYRTGFNEYLPQKLQARRLEIWDELQTRLRPINGKCTAANFDKWYWSTRTMYGKAIRKPSKPCIPGKKETRQQYIYRSWAFHKPFITGKSEKEKEEPV